MRTLPQSFYFFSRRLKMPRLINIRRAGAAILVVFAAACSDVTAPEAVGPNTKPAPATVSAIGPNTATANGVGTSPRPQP